MGLRRLGEAPRAHLTVAWTRLLRYGLAVRLEAAAVRVQALQRLTDAAGTARPVRQLWAVMLKLLGWMPPAQLLAAAEQAS